jgi:hypothetical protein
MRNLQGSLIPMPGPIYMPAEVILNAAAMILGQQQQQLMPQMLDDPQLPSKTVFPPQAFYEEDIDSTNQRPPQQPAPQTNILRRSNTNWQSGIQQFGTGNVNLQGNIQQINRRRVMSYFN